MGMYDCIDFKIKCPKCKVMITEFQSKDGPCLMYRLNFWEVDNFYTACDKCKTWVEFTLKKESKSKYKLSDYKMELSKG